jgi:hypothetical protein
VIFEGRDTAGKGGVISRITARTSPRVYRHVALPAPSDREKTHHLEPPAAPFLICRQPVRDGACSCQLRGKFETRCASPGPLRAPDP